MKLGIIHPAGLLSGVSVLPVRGVLNAHISLREGGVYTCEGFQPEGMPMPWLPHGSRVHVRQVAGGLELFATAELAEKYGLPAFQRLGIIPLAERVPQWHPSPAPNGSAGGTPTMAAHWSPLAEGMASPQTAPHPLADARPPAGPPMQPAPAAVPPHAPAQQDTQAASGATSPCEAILLGPLMLSWRRGWWAAQAARLRRWIAARRAPAAPALPTKTQIDP